MYDNRFLLLITRKLSGEASQQELDELNGMIAADPALKGEVEIYTRYWEQQQEENADTELALQKVLKQINSDVEVTDPTIEEIPVKRIPVWKTIARVAAMLILLAGLGIGTYKLL